jgi:regulator of protease activity HflC (stomatin/prohibitin superfamily)
MTGQTVSETDPAAPGRNIAERGARSASGVLVLVLSIVALVLGVVLLVAGGARASKAGGGAAGPVLIAVGCVLVIIAVFALYGLTPVIVGEARVVQLFGAYRGTIRQAGLCWVNPLTRRRRVSTRVRNHETAVAKVNDADGIPIEIAAVVVWQVLDTAKAIYAVDDFTDFVSIQAEAAVRHIATSYAYDSHGTGEPSLRGNVPEVTRALSDEIVQRVAPAGVQVVESRLTWLAYAPEIAPTMLRRQQAHAVVDARQRIVEGAVGMVRMALQQLEDQGVVELDEERKAAMVSNLLVVLCSEQATQQVVNTGTLYS